MVRAQSDPTISGPGGNRAAWYNLLGAGVNIGMVEALVMAGYGRHVSIGAFSTPITGGGAGTVLDLDQPEGLVSVPNGVAIRPISIRFQGHQPLLATDADEAEVIVAVDVAGAWNGDGATTAETIYNMRTGLPSSSGCIAASAFTGDMTTGVVAADPVLAIELAARRNTGDVQGTPATALQTALDFVYEPAIAPWIVGPATLLLYWGGTVALPGFAQLQFLEVPTEFMDLLD